MTRTTYGNLSAFITKDGSIIRELMHPSVHGGKNISLAEAVIPAGTETLLHIHSETEEIYHITSGRGYMTLGDDQFEVFPGDTILIPPKTPHRIQNTGSDDLKILCCCSPPYSHADTKIMP